MYDNATTICGRYDAIAYENLKYERLRYYDMRELRYYFLRILSRFKEVKRYVVHLPSDFMFFTYFHNINFAKFIPHYRVFILYCFLILKMNSPLLRATLVIFSSVGSTLAE